MVASATIFTAAADVALSHFVSVRNQQYLNDLNNTVLRRAEGNVDDAKRLLTSLGDQHIGTCSDVMLEATRLRVYQNNLIKDIRALDTDGNVRCSAYSDTLEFDKTWATKADMMPGRDANVHLFRVERFFSDALGVLVETGEAGGLAAIVGIDAPQFDVLPTDLREAGRVSLVLDNGQVVAAHGPAGLSDSAPLATTDHSDRYPIRTNIHIDQAALARWNEVSFWGFPALAGVMGLLFGFVLARALDRPPNPVGELDRAIANGEFAPYFQPIFSLQDRRIIGCEALMRWIKPDGRVIGPGAFMPLAESSGRIEAMTWQLLEKALLQLGPAMRANPRFKLSVNIVPGHLLRDAFRGTLLGIVTTAGASPSQIVLEITERDELADLVRAASTIAALQADGFRIAIDDVGVGHSGLSYIQTLRANTLKIDKFFVDSLAFSETARAVIGMLVGLARELKMTVVAEGIETDGQMQALQACQVDEGQGYLISPPLPPTSFLSMLDADRAKLVASPTRVAA